MVSKFCQISHKIFQSALIGGAEKEFLKNILSTLKDHTDCDYLELHLKQSNVLHMAKLYKDRDNAIQFETLCSLFNNPKKNIDHLSLLSHKILNKDIALKCDARSAKGIFLTGDSNHTFKISYIENSQTKNIEIIPECLYKSLAILPFDIGESDAGLLILKDNDKEHFTEKNISFLEELCVLLADAVTLQHAQATLKERVKEISCLYEISEIVKRPGITAEEIFQYIADLLPKAFQYPEMARSRIIINQKEYTSGTFFNSVARLTADIILSDVQIGAVEVIYQDNADTTQSWPFLTEEQNLLDAVAQQTALIIERKRAEEERARLQDQLRHADRLATIGQLSAGVAHELNEPLSNILGFAQLSIKTPDLPVLLKSDLNNIINASLHAREVIKKLMLFGRQMPPRKMEVNLNKLIRDGLFFLESRCAKSGIELKRKLSKDIGFITADPSQMHQIIVNLVVNAIQAMPNGGKLIIETRAAKGSVQLRIKDTGTGMDKATMNQIFIPFFTTKDINEGTGLGLAVVHGIVRSHNGNIQVESKVGAGTTFTVSLPQEGKGEDNGS